MKKIVLKNKGFVLPLMIAIVAILAIGGTVYLAEHKKAEAPVVENVDTTNWKTYRNGKFSFEFKYPADWKIIPDGMSEKENHLGFYKDDMRMMGVINPIREIGYEGLDLLSREQIKISNRDFPLTKILYVDNEDKTYRYINISWAPSDWSMSGELWFSFREGDIQREKEINGIISSLMFIPVGTEQTVVCAADTHQCSDGTYVGRTGPKCEFVCPVSNEVSNWKAHTNNKYGFEFKYPANWEKVYDFTPSESYYPIVSQTSIFITFPAQDVSSEVSVYDVNLEVALSGDLNLPDSTPTTTLVNGISWITISDSYGANYFTENHGRTYRISAAHDIVGKIIQSFRFIEPGVEKPIACTKDAFMCPDGTYVGRSGPKCEFICPK